MTDVVDNDDKARVRQAILDAAYGEILNVRTSEYWRDVLGPDWAGPFPKHWCGAFCLWALHQVGAGLDVSWKVGKGFLYKLKQTKQPRSGDVVYFDKPFQHHALFVRFDGDKLVTIDGNQGAPRPVREVVRPRNRATAFYSVEPWLPEAPAPVLGNPG